MHLGSEDKGVAGRGDVKARGDALECTRSRGQADRVPERPGGRFKGAILALEREENRFALVLMAAQRSRQLMRSSEPLVH